MKELPRELSEKKDRLLDLLRSYESCAVAFSGGLDSAVLAKAAQLALGEKAVAVTGVSDSLAVGELDEAKEVAEAIGIKHEVVETGELKIPEYQENTSNRCYHCKTELFRQVEAIASQTEMAVVADGSNRDDHGEHRPGIRAAQEQKVCSPLADSDFTKDEIRALAAHWELPIWDKPATPCLSSRIAYGEQVTSERLAMIDAAERFLRDKGFQPLRVRYHRGDVARVEVASEEVRRLTEEPLRSEIVERLKKAGFQYVSIDLEGFRSGSLNAVLPTELLQISDKRK